MSDRSDGGGRDTATTAGPWPGVALDAPAQSGHAQRADGRARDGQSLGKRIRVEPGKLRDQAPPCAWRRRAAAALWMSRGRMTEGMAWLETALADANAQNRESRDPSAGPTRTSPSASAPWVSSAALTKPSRARHWHGAREIADPALVIRGARRAPAPPALDPVVTQRRPLPDEAATLARKIGDSLAAEPGSL